MITKVKKSRKECVCGRCRKVIPVGSSYFRGDLNFSKPVIRCTECGLEGWEVTTSEYQLSVGEIVYRWSNNYDADEAGRDNLVEDLENIKSEVEDRFDAMPDSLQYGDTGMLLQERIDGLDAAINELYEIDFDEESEESVDFAELIDNALSNIEI